VHIAEASVFANGVRQPDHRGDGWIARLVGHIAGGIEVGTLAGDG